MVMFFPPYPYLGTMQRVLLFLLSILVSAAQPGTVVEFEAVKTCPDGCAVCALCIDECTACSPCATCQSGLCAPWCGCSQCADCGDACRQCHRCAPFYPAAIFSGAQPAIQSDQLTYHVLPVGYAMVLSSENTVSCQGSFGLEIDVSGLNLQTVRERGGLHAPFHLTVQVLENQMLCIARLDACTACGDACALEWQVKRYQGALNVALLRNGRLVAHGAISIPDKQGKYIYHVVILY